VPLGGRSLKLVGVEPVFLKKAHAIATGHKAQKIRVIGYLLWDDEHNGSADVGSSIQYLSKNGFHHPWRSKAWEIHPVMKIEVIQ
jgi:hypothetical protein